VIAAGSVSTHAIARLRNEREAERDQQRDPEQRERQQIVGLDAPKIGHEPRGRIDRAGGKNGERRNAAEPLGPGRQAGVMQRMTFMDSASRNRRFTHGHCPTPLNAKRRETRSGAR
jgi:hypothetical protein